MIPLAALELLRRWWPAVVVLALLAAAGIGGMRLVSIGAKLERAEALAEALEARLTSCQRNAITAEQLRADVARCEAAVADAQAAAGRWQTAYENAERRPPRIVEMPVEVAAPGTPCEDAVTQIAGWLAREVTDGQ